METQRLEELALKQSRQLIPVTPSTLKNVAFSSSDKQKMRARQQHQPLSSLNHSPRLGEVKQDAIKASSNMGKLHVLKPVRDNNVTMAAAVAKHPAKFPPVVDRKPALTVLEKRPTPQAQSRNDFFNSVRKKSMPNSPPDKVDVAEDASSELGAYPSFDSRDDIAMNGKHPETGIMFSEEEEAAFLRSLGWEENSDEGGLTEEEINGFLRDAPKGFNTKTNMKLVLPNL